MALRLAGFHPRAYLGLALAAATSAGSGSFIFLISNGTEARRLATSDGHRLHAQARPKLDSEHLSNGSALQNPSSADASHPASLTSERKLARTHGREWNV